MDLNYFSKLLELKQRIAKYVNLERKHYALRRIHSLHRIIALITSITITRKKLNQQQSALTFNASWLFTVDII
ncbi:MAG: hypothetical protein ACTS85_00690 [Arsenophonus sp. NC-PG7-MAG3]